ncbi:MAG: hypothetical protein ACUVQ1_09615 [Candidatus Kapaibacteriales bacterium]
MEVKQLFIEQTEITQNELLNKVNECIAKGTQSNFESRFINEALVAIDKVLECNFLLPHDRVLLEKTFRYGSDSVHERLNYFSNYYYAYANISKGDINTQQSAFIQINADTSSMLTTILGFNRNICGIDGSTDNYFVERMPRVLWAIQFVLKKQLTEIYLPSMYILINLEQVLTEYIFCKDNQYKEKANELLIEIDNLSKQFRLKNEVNELLKSNTQLALFLATQTIRKNSILGRNEELEFSEIQEFPKIKCENKLRILTSLFYLDKEGFLTHFGKELPEIINDIYRSSPTISNFLFLQCLAFYSYLKPQFDNLELNLDPISKTKINLQENLRLIFNRYDESNTETISEVELNLLLGYNDEILREKVANTIIGVDKNTLDREKKKPHRVFEISDMELRVRLHQGNYFLCMPFKSGIEIKTPTVPEVISYQIFRPFIHFDKAIVIFVTAKRCSQNLMNYIKRMEDKLGWGIAVLENEELAKLLKVNGQLN